MEHDKSQLLKLDYDMIYNMYDKSSNIKEKELLKQVIEEKSMNDDKPEDINFQS